MKGAGGVDCLLAEPRLAALGLQQGSKGLGCGLGWSVGVGWVIEG